MEPITNSPMTEFELCRELNRLAFPQKRRDDSWYFVRPDLLIQMRDKDSLYGLNKRPMNDFFETAIYYPSEEDLREYLGDEFQQLILTAASGWFSYCNSPTIKGATVRSNAPGAWLALANNVYGYLLEKSGALKDQMEKAMGSENVEKAVVDEEVPTPVAKTDI